MSITFEYGEDYGSLVRRNRTQLSVLADFANASILRNGAHIALNLTPLLLGDDSQNAQQVLENDTLVIPFYKQSLGFSQSGSTANASVTAASAAVTGGVNPQNVQIAMSSPDYPVTPGDVYTLAYAAGSESVTYSIAVDTTYQVRVANLDIVDATGKTFNQLKTQVETIVSENYPLSGVQLALTAPALFTIQIKGEVAQAGERQVWALQRLSTFAAGDNLTAYSSIRDVKITSSSGSTATYDLFKAGRFGDLSQDPYVRPGDVITVNRVDRVVTIGGAMERPGRYQLLPGENLSELVAFYANGATPAADTSRIELIRLIGGKEESGDKLYLTQTDIAANFDLQHMDAITIPVITDLMPVMFVEGAVLSAADAALESSNRLTVRFNMGENYATLVRRNRAWFSPVSDTQKAYIVRGETRIHLDLNPLLYDSNNRSEEDVQDSDVLVIPFRQYFVSVAGAVMSPGRFPYIPDRDWEYYIGLAGGFNPDRNSLESIFIRNIDGTRLKKTDPITPETTITAHTNSFLYGFNRWAPIVTTVLSIITSFFTVMAVTGAL
jgi:protein involved in polysaccharide export with SLBB domain